MGCRFCATARMGLVRNLRPSEIVGQVGAGIAVAAPATVTNVVFMGMGEPLANYGPVKTALEILTAEWGYAISPRRITVSTVGLAPAVARLIAETGVNLAVSLSASTDVQRDRQSLSLHLGSRAWNWTSWRATPNRCRINRP